jgi:hypothetical protein
MSGGQLSRPAAARPARRAAGLGVAAREALLVAVPLAVAWLALLLALLVGADAQAAPVAVPDPAEWARLSPEQQEARRAEMRQQLQRATPAERAAFRQQLRERLERLSPQQRQALADQTRERWEQMPAEQRERLVQERRERLQAMSPRERRQMFEQRRQMLEKLSPEERAALREKLPEH